MNDVPPPSPNIYQLQDGDEGGVSWCNQCSVLVRDAAKNGIFLVVWPLKPLVPLEFRQLLVAGPLNKRPFFAASLRGQFLKFL